MFVDAYKDVRFDSTIDKKTQYCTEQVACVPVLHPLTLQVIGALQVSNRANNTEIHNNIEFPMCQWLVSVQLSYPLL